MLIHRDRRARSYATHDGVRFKCLFGQAEIQHLGLVAVGHKNVGGLDIAMNNAFRVRRFQRVRDLDGQLEQHIHRESLLPDPQLERLPFEQLHGDEIAAIGLPDLVDGADIRMVQSRRRAGFTLKALQRRSVFFQFSRQEFQGYVPAKIHVFGFIHHAHAAATKLVQDAVVRDGFARDQQSTPK